MIMATALPKLCATPRASRFTGGAPPANTAMTLRLVAALNRKTAVTNTEYPKHHAPANRGPHEYELTSGISPPLGPPVGVIAAAFTCVFFVSLHNK